MSKSIKMDSDTDAEKENTQCPTCDRDDFVDEAGMKRHHTMTHGESIAYKMETCDYCGDKFEILKCKDRRFCKDECYFKEKSDNMKGEGNFNWKGAERVILPCGNCGREYSLTMHQAEKKAWSPLAYCSSCKSDWASQWGSKNHEEMKEEYGMKTDYKQKVEDAIDKVHERDGYQCVICDLSNKKHIEKFGMKLHAHHIGGREQYLDKENKTVDNGIYKKENMITLCVNHHSSVERGDIKEPTVGEV